MMRSISKAVFCVGVSISIAAASWVNAGPAWYSPLYSVTEEGEILNITFETENGKAIPTKIYREPDNRTISVQVPTKVDRSALVPEFEVTDGFTVEPESNQARDFSEPVTNILRSGETDRTFEWQVKVFDADTGMIFRGEDFKHWKMRADGFDRDDVWPGEFFREQTC